MLAAMRRTVLAALVAGLALTGAAAAQSGEDARAAREPLRVLFVGNSLTATNDLPAIVAALGAAAKRVPIEYATVAPGGVNLEDHWTFTGARDALLARPWDVVVLQQGPSSLPESQVDLRTWAVRWAELARERGIRTAMLTVWPEGRAPTRSRRSSARIAPPPWRRGRRSCRPGRRGSRPGGGRRGSRCTALTTSTRASSARRWRPSSSTPGSRARRRAPSRCRSTRARPGSCARPRQTRSAST